MDGFRVPRWVPGRRTSAESSVRHTGPSAADWGGEIDAFVGHTSALYYNDFSALCYTIFYISGAQWVRVHYVSMYITREALSLVS